MRTELVTSPVGEYYLQGVMETASGFHLQPDNSFQFFFSYGALDRFGKGKWTVKDDTVLFNSEPKPLHDFALLDSKPGLKNAIIIRVKEGDPVLLSHLFCRIKGEGQEQEGMLNQNGEIAFRPQPLETIEMRFEFCPEKNSVFSVEKEGHNLFEFRPEAWLMDVSFNDFSLSFSGDSLTGGHPLSNKTSFRFEKLAST